MISVYIYIYISSHCMLPRAACSVVSAFIERHACSLGREDSRCLEFKITTYCKFK